MFKNNKNLIAKIILVVIALGVLEVRFGKFLLRLLWKLLYNLTNFVEKLGWLVTITSSKTAWYLLNIFYIPVRLSLALFSVFNRRAKKMQNNFNAFLTIKKDKINYKKEKAATFLNKKTEKTKDNIDKKIKRLAKVQVKPHASFLRPVLSFAVVLFLIMAPLAGFRHFNWLMNIKTKVVNSAQAAISKVKFAKDDAFNKNLKGASNNLDSASQDFLSAETEINKINGLLLAIAGAMPDSKLKLAAEGKQFAAAGRLGTEMAVALTEAVNSLVNAGTFSDKINGFIAKSSEANSKAQELQNIIKEINVKNIPAAYQEDFALLQEKSSLLTASLSEIVDIAQKLKIFAGVDTDKRYLVVFQNNTELRATGGFMGSFSVADLSKGQLKKMITPGGGTYDTEGGMRTHIIAPEPLWLVNADWHFWDANWWPDWPTSARKLEWFYDKADGSTVDGVIALTPQPILDLIDLFGPIELPERNLTITSANFMDEVQYVAEQKTGATSTPKTIISEMSAQLMEKAGANLDKEKIIKLLSVFTRALAEKKIILYFNDAELARKAASLNWDGAQKETSGDYLMVVHTNIAGGKSDRRIVDNIEHEASIASDGSIIDTVTIRRKHNGTADDLFSGVRNNDWLRVYVPLGSKLISATGFKKTLEIEKHLEKPNPTWESDPDLKNETLAEIDKESLTKIYRENNKTVFANWLQVGRGKTIEVKLVYKLPFVLQKENNDSNLPFESRIAKYTLLIQKQPGTDMFYKSDVSLGDTGKLLWRYPETINNTPEILNTDKIKAYLIGY